VAESSTSPKARDFVVHAPPEQGPFRHPLNPRSEVYGVMLARMVGLSRLGVNLARLAPGKESFVFHMHRAEEEWLYILAGAATVEIGDESFALAPGDFAGFPPGSFAHHVRNDGPGDLAYLSGGETREVEVGEFPRQGQRLVRLPHEATVYPLSSGEPLVPMAPAGAPEVAPRDLLVRAGDLAASAETAFRHKLNPRSQVRGHRLSDRVGLARLGVNVARLAPGKESYVFHRHAIEEEWLYVLSGRAVAEIGDGRVELAAGDFAGFPPRAPGHLITNPYAEEVSYLEGGEVLAVDVVDFPRLGKRIVRIGDERTMYEASAGEPFFHAPPEVP
jgi:uncharacterized cupin superfamily protein